jgi:hypothetical protein
MESYDAGVEPDLRYVRCSSPALSDPDISGNMWPDIWTFP